MTEQIPEAWRGQKVTVVPHMQSEKLGRDGTLQDITERGVVLQELGHDRETVYFYPWTSIIHIRHPVSSGAAATSSRSF